MNNLQSMLAGMGEFMMPVNPEKCLMVGDRPEDEGAANAAGCSFAWANDFFAQAVPLPYEAQELDSEPPMGWQPYY